MSGRFKTRKQTLSINDLKTQHIGRKFGTFLHFNQDTFLDSDGSDGTQSVNAFNPSALNIDQWMTNIRAAKSTYAVLTAKHISGYCLWPSATTTYNVSNSSWSYSHGNPDICRLFVESCIRFNIEPFFYICAKDRNFEVNNPSPSQAAYKSFLQSLITELLSNYGKIGGIWLDANIQVFFPSTNDGYPWASFAEAVTFVHGVQSSALCIDSSQTLNAADSDIVEYEGGNLPGNFVPALNTFPAECCETIYNDGTPSSWFWKSDSLSRTIRSTSTLISNIATANSRTSNYLINFPPDNTGNIESRMASVMAAIGAR